MSNQSNLPHCEGDQITRAGKSSSGEQRYRCRAEDCPTITFMLNNRYTAYKPGIKKQVVEMASMAVVYVTPLVF